MRGGREKPFIGSCIGFSMTKSNPAPIRIRRAQASDRDDWVRMRALLWPDCTLEQHREEVDEYLQDKAGVAFVAARPDGRLAGFVESTIRAQAECCDTRPVGYVEGWYVDADVRRLGVGRRLVRAAERWARGVGCIEMGSDCLLENNVSLRAHLAMGYEERERLIHFRRWLARPPARPRA
jgi:aminoglycoside 6'-N-acetyltransferase I